MGHARMGFPWLRLSTVEFHPQWLMNAAIALCARISSCGAHPVTTTPAQAAPGPSSDAAAARRVSAAASPSPPPRGPAARASAGEWEKHWAKRPDGEQPLAVGGRDALERVEEVALESAAGVDDHAGTRRAPALLAHPHGERDELRGGAGVGRVEDEAVAAQQGVLPVRPPDVVGGGEAVHAEGLGVGQARGLGRRERRHVVVEDDDAAVGRGQLRQERGQRGPCAAAVGLVEMCAGNGEDGLGEGDSCGRTFSARKRTAAGRVPYQLCRRARASQRCGSGAAKWTGSPRAARSRDRCSSWFRWPCVGNGTVMMATAADSMSIARLGLGMRAWVGLDVIVM